MNSAGNANAPTSATTSSSAPASAAATATNPGELSEAQFLQQQAQLAKDAVARTFQQFTAGLGQGANPVEWAREYPWISVGAAAALGFVAANMLIPTKEDQALKKLARLERALSSPPPPVVDGSTPDKDPAKHGMLYGLMNQTLKAIQPAIISAITAHVAKNEPKNAQQAPAGSAASPQGRGPGAV
jgi:hypothetical protein